MKKIIKSLLVAGMALAAVAGAAGTANAATAFTKQYGMGLSVINNPSWSGNEQVELCNYNSWTIEYYVYTQMSVPGEGNMDLYMTSSQPQSKASWANYSGYHEGDLVHLAPGLCYSWTFNAVYPSDHNSVKVYVKNGSTWTFDSGWVNWD